jgi:hypothetical protein
MINDYGDPQSDLEKRLLAKCILTNEGHILWTGNLSNGHGTISYKNKTIGVHTASAMLYMQNFNPRLQTLHKPSCNIGNCIAIPHLYQGDYRQNILDQVIAGTHNMARKTHCPRGHEYNAKNTHIYKERRICRECDRIRSLFK